MHNLPASFNFHHPRPGPHILSRIRAVLAIVIRQRYNILLRDRYTIQQGVIQVFGEVATFTRHQKYTHLIRVYTIYIRGLQ